MGKDGSADTGDTLVFGADGLRGIAVIKGFDPTLHAILLRDGQDVAFDDVSLGNTVLRLSGDGDI